jgi:hypothetical protein
MSENKKSSDKEINTQPKLSSVDLSQALIQSGSGSNKQSLNMNKLRNFFPGKPKAPNTFLLTQNDV